MESQSKQPPRSTPAQRRWTFDSDHTPPLAMDHGLYVVATPIGNLLDITIRALDVLDGADLILAEDTRITRRLLTRYGIETPVQAYHDHNAAQLRPQVIARITSGEVIAQVSDAGTPLISDPGFKLVAEVLNAGLRVVPIPGASAVLTAMMAAGLSTDAIHFAGFLPNKAEARRQRLVAVKTIRASLVFYESPGRMAATLDAAAEVLGDRQAAVCRELTKRFEEIKRGTLLALAEWAAAATPKGECVLVIDGARDESTDDVELDDALTNALTAHSLKDAVALVAGATGLPRKEVYQRALALAKTKDD